LPEINEIGRELAGIFKKHHADYLEARLEENHSSNIHYQGRPLESVGKNTSVGGNVRALVRGGWGFVSFNSFDNLSGKVGIAIKQAELAGHEKSELAPVPVVTEKVKACISRNPADISLAEKKELLDGYNDLIWRTLNIKTSTVSYGDSYKRTIFLNSEGSFIEQDRADFTIRLSAIASDGHEVQQANLSLGSLNDFDAISQLDSRVSEMAQRATALLAAPQVKGGEYTVVLDPILAGVFVHEAFGHLSESDHIYENQELRQVMKIGKRFGSKELNIVDGAAVPALRGSYKYDDEGVAATKTYLVSEGVLASRLHSRETAAKMAEKPSGNARAISYRYPPIVRMTNTYIEPGDIELTDILADIKTGIYAANWYGGTTSMEMFTFSSGEAYMIRNGKLAELLRPVVLSGNVFHTLANIDAIGNDLEMNQGGGCGKGGQSPLPVSNGSPHIRIQRCLLGGKG
jgi:TldD protein